MMATLLMPAGVTSIASIKYKDEDEILDKADYIKEQYYLEVSSPGIERKLRKDKHLEQNISKNVEIKLFKKDNNGKKEYTGKLKAFNQEEIIIETDKEIAIERKNIAQIKTIYEYKYERFCKK